MNNKIINKKLTSFSAHLDEQYEKKEHQKESNMRKNLKLLN